jgi:5-methylcytosine-specific restriction protein A
MPYAPLKPCNWHWPPCANLIDRKERFCAEHKTAHSRDRQQIHGTSYQRGYDSNWRRLRLAALMRDQFICHATDAQGCMKLGIVTPATEVDHVIPFEGKDDPLRLDINNLKSLCTECHHRKTATQQKRNTMRVKQPAPALKKLTFA